MLRAGFAHVGPSWAHIEPSCEYLRLMLRQVGPMFSHRAHLGPMLGRWAHVELCWAHLGSMSGQVGPMLAHVEPSWELCWGHVGAMFGPSMLKRS